mgnify:CR=1 FL=1
MWYVATLGVTSRVWARAASIARASPMSSSLAGSSSSNYGYQYPLRYYFSQRFLHVSSLVSHVSSCVPFSVSTAWTCCYVLLVSLKPLEV